MMVKTVTLAVGTAVDLYIDIASLSPNDWKTFRFVDYLATLSARGREEIVRSLLYELADRFPELEPALVGAMNGFDEVVCGKP